ncbi:hypothetical protein F511_10337 [Dorcoceras hygrometricum]|uniref:Uncharacterized protein n=1 Tax=Dorcoceras hygrometricum TaxID=472368 RepID=A0A2Z7CNJ0_9LAMI|nr:hypothetical protein F511_10337 [Dorcoceras hygrometricum]
MRRRFDGAIVNVCDAFLVVSRFMCMCGELSRFEAMQRLHYGFSAGRGVGPAGIASGGG